MITMLRKFIRRGQCGPGIYKSLRSLHNVIGIDLGTTNSAVAIVEGDTARVIENEEGARTTPSVVAFTDRDSEPLVGIQARRQAAINTANTFFATKRLIGRKFSDEEVQVDMHISPYKIVQHSNGDAWVETKGGDQFSPTSISGYILKKMRHVAEQHIGAPVQHAVVTVPAYFNDAQRQATKNAGRIAGLDVLRVINEPTAAALAYGIDKTREDGIIAVYDFGGGTFDISILEIDQGVFEVRATNGNTHLGGEDFDIILLNHILKKFKESNSGLDISKDQVVLQKIRESAEKCKIQLSHTKKAEINIPFVTKDKHIQLEITEDELDEMTLHLINKTVEPVKKCLKDAQIKRKDVNEVLMVGGMTRMPKIRKVVKDIFDKEPNTTINPDEAVALGASIQGAVLSGQIKNVVLLDVTPLTLGIETYGGIFSPLIPRNSPVPTKKEQIFSTAVDGQTGVEIRVFQGERQLVDDNKLIGNFRLGGIPPGPKGTPQIAVEFEIDADGIINVSAKDKTKYSEDSEYYGKNNKVSIQVSGDTGLSEQEIDKLIQESKAFSESDNKKRMSMENANRIEIICSDAENAILLYGELMEDSEAKDINDKLKSLKSLSSEIRTGKRELSEDSIREEIDALQKSCLEAIKKVAIKQREN